VIAVQTVYDCVHVLQYLRYILQKVQVHLHQPCQTVTYTNKSGKDATDAIQDCQLQV